MKLSEKEKRKISLLIKATIKTFNFPNKISNDDLYQECWLVYLKDIKRFRKKKTNKKYSYYFFVYQCRKVIKKLCWSHSKEQNNIENEAVYEKKSKKIDVLELLDHTESLYLLKKYIIGHYTYKELAEKLGVSITTIHFWLKKEIKNKLLEIKNAI